MMEEPLASYQISCPYCGESVEIAIEEDLAGEMIWDCEVCCRPWAVSVRGRGSDREVTARTLEE